MILKLSLPSLFILLLSSTMSFPAFSIQLVGQIITQYQTSSGEIHKLVLMTGDKAYPLTFKQDSSKRRNERKLKRQSGKIVRINGRLKNLESKKNPYQFEKFIQINSYRDESTKKKAQGIIKRNKNNRNSLDKYKIHESGSFSRKTPIILSLFDDEDFDQVYQDQPVEIEYSEFYVSWRRIRFVSSIKIIK